MARKTRATACCAAWPASRPGRVVRDCALPTADLTIRKLAAIEALSRHGRAEPRMLDSITDRSDLWPTSAVIDWIGTAEARPAKLPRRAERLERGPQVILAPASTSRAR